MECFIVATTMGLWAYSPGPILGVVLILGILAILSNFRWQHFFSQTLHSFAGNQRAHDIQYWEGAQTTKENGEKAVNSSELWRGIENTFLIFAVISLMFIFCMGYVFV